jgi:hypothetical protein
MTQLRDAGHHALPVPSHSIAVHIAGECNVAKIGKAPCLLFGVVIQAGASVDNQNAGPIFDGPVVRGKHAGEGLVVVNVFDC